LPIARHAVCNRIRRIAAVAKQRDHISLPANVNQLKGERIMGGRMIWALLFVIGVPLPILFILYMLFGG
jgi:hypothetical protein